MSLQPRQLLIVDDHPIVRHGILNLIAAQCMPLQCREAASMDAALSLLEHWLPDIILLDLKLGQENGLHLIPKLRARNMHCPILVLSVHDESIYAERALKAGAQGYLMKDAGPDQLMDAIQRILRGETFVSSAMHQKLMSAWTSGKALSEGIGVANLSDRELEVMQLVGQGLSSGQIAEQLQRSVKTIESHKATIQRKLGLESSGQLARYAAIWSDQNP
jgi:DNA-binding NarL/FixJ family response regulator